jgi:tetratricopeptide (TPR) repeat protein
MTRVNNMTMRKFSFWIGALVIAAGTLGGCDLLTSPETRMSRAREHIDEGENRAAIIELRKVLEDEPANARARLLLAEAEFASGDISAAEADLDRALEAGAAAADAAKLKAQLQLAFGRHQVLLTQLEAGEISIAEPERSLLRGRALLGLDQPDEARRAFERAGRRPGFYGCEARRDRGNRGLWQRQPRARGARADCRGRS